ncbi:hypothetical protein [Mangrovicoccus algicola]|uniref:Uncharacterized protein n=1 Tax=Mangrovicoccus algicola TaxID=2771008 RepID=A0A8J6YUH7_9RHOB|nr:hypothetical protein [Mangrovicoccus algicola]MBE3637837.1 hypothetical protein [Mangrovicoccus algicola]
MIYLKIALFSLRQLSALGLWQAGAELGGSPELRRRAARHRRLQSAAAEALRDQLRADLASAAPAPGPRPR